MKYSLVVTDLDNTLYDWVGYFVPAFYAMVNKVVDITGCDREQLLSDFQKVHRAHHTSERPFALLETRTIQTLYMGWQSDQIAKELDPAFHAFNALRKSSLALYPGVEFGLRQIKERGLKVVAHTESDLIGVVDRLTRLGIAGYFDAIFCIERPSPARRLETEWPVLAHFPLNKVRELSHHQRKPDPEVLAEICKSSGAEKAETIYVGDSLTRDMLLAKQSGVTSAWARYGTRHDPGLYEQLIRISHWTPHDIARERQLKSEASGLAPDYVLDRSFNELLCVLDEIKPAKFPH